MANQLTKPRPWSKITAGVAPGRDARWRGVRFNVKTINRARVHEMQQKQR